MGKKVVAKLRMQIPGGGATPAPPVGAVLGQQGVNIMNFCKAFNAKTADKKGQTVPVVVYVYADKSFDFAVKTQPTAELIRQKAGVAKGVSEHAAGPAGQITWAQVEDVAQAKMSDLNANDIEAAKKIVAGSARSMGIKVVED
jgi:large subunit ribosomal protein L11